MPLGIRSPNEATSTEQGTQAYRSKEQSLALRSNGDYVSPKNREQRAEWV
jgi:hypothetical protein